MSHSTPVPPPRTSRRLVLGAALLLALLIGLPPRSPPASAEDAKAPATRSPAAEAEAQTPAPAKSNRESAEQAISIDLGSLLLGKEDVKGVEKDPDDTDVFSSDDPGTITIRKNGKTIRITGLPPDRRFDSVSQFVHTEPTLATGVVVTVAIVFLAPVLAIALILGYRMRKARMLSETMLRLAETGTVPSADALEALAGKATPRRADFVPAAGGFYALSDQARDIRKRAAWSDLRKGVVMSAIGLAMSLYSVIDDRSPNVVALVLLFVGIGYIALWWFEDRKIMLAAPLPAAPPPAPPSAALPPGGAKPGDGAGP